jgi:hypothetical protein
MGSSRRKKIVTLDEDMFEIFLEKWKKNKKNEKKEKESKPIIDAWQHNYSQKKPSHCIKKVTFSHSKPPSFFKTPTSEAIKEDQKEYNKNRKKKYCLVM